jgi:hypothetical protein
MLDNGWIFSSKWVHWLNAETNVVEETWSSSLSRIPIQKLVRAI